MEFYGILLQILKNLHHHRYKYLRFNSAFGVKWTSAVIVRTGQTERLAGGSVLSHAGGGEI